MRIVVGFDGSDHAQRALERAADLAGDGDRLAVVSASEPHLGIGITHGGHRDPSTAQHRHDAAEKARAFLADRGLDAEIIETEGDPGTAIIEAAKDADLIVVGTRGLNPIQRIMVGSVSSKVVHRAPCDVLVIR
jgi:nucleotide-binding universal stress UspA family protein